MPAHAPPSPLFPVFLRLDGRPVLVVGGGAVALGKVSGLVAAGAKVRVVAPSHCPELHDLAVREPNVELHPRPFAPSDLDDAWFVVAAATPEVNRAVNEAAQARRIFVNAVDDPAAATAYLGGVIRRDGVTVAVSTDGAAPALAGLLKQALDALLPADLSEWVATARRERDGWRQRGVPLAERRPLLLRALNSLYDRPRAGGLE